MSASDVQQRVRSLTSEALASDMGLSLHAPLAELHDMHEWRLEELRQQNQCLLIQRSFLESAVEHANVERMAAISKAARLRTQLGALQAASNRYWHDLQQQKCAASEVQARLDRALASNKALQTAVSVANQRAEAAEAQATAAQRRADEAAERAEAEEALGWQRQMEAVKKAQATLKAKHELELQQQSTDVRTEVARTIRTSQLLRENLADAERRAQELTTERETAVEEGRKRVAAAEARAADAISRANELEAKLIEVGNHFSSVACQNDAGDAIGDGSPPSSDPVCCVTCLAASCSPTHHGDNGNAVCIR